MATEFVMPRMLEQMQPRFYQHQYQYPPALSQSQSPTSRAQSIYQPQQISPLSTSDNASPTASSPMSQNNPRMQPVYMPAVLRPNEYPFKPLPPKKPEDADQSSLQSNHSFLSLNGWGVLGRLTRRATADSGKCLDDDDDDDAVQWNLDLFPKPTAQPTKEHWKADPESTMCDEPSCMRRFNYWTRRHHCRKCGNIFCDWHSAYDVPLDQDANYNPRGTPSRACFHCFSAFKAWRSRTNSQASSDNSSVTNGSQSAPASPVVSGPTAKNMAQRQPHPSEIAMSVPRDWNWSTF